MMRSLHIWAQGGLENEPGSSLLANMANSTRFARRYEPEQLFLRDSTSQDRLPNRLVAMGGLPAHHLALAIQARQATVHGVVSAHVVHEAVRRVRVCEKVEGVPEGLSRERLRKRPRISFTCRNNDGDLIRPLTPRVWRQGGRRGVRE